MKFCLLVKIKNQKGFNHFSSYWTNFFNSQSFEATSNFFSQWTTSLTTADWKYDHSWLEIWASEVRQRMTIFLLLRSWRDVPNEAWGDPALGAVREVLLWGVAVWGAAQRRLCCRTKTITSKLSGSTKFWKLNEGILKSLMVAVVTWHSRENLDYWSRKVLTKQQCHVQCGWGEGGGSWTYSLISCGV